MFVNVASSVSSSFATPTVVVSSKKDVLEKGFLSVAGTGEKEAVVEVAAGSFWSSSSYFCFSCAMEWKAVASRPFVPYPYAGKKSVVVVEMPLPCSATKRQGRE